MLSPKTLSTRLQLPLGVASSGEPPAAEVGSLSYDTATDKVRVKTSTGWQDVSSSGGGGAPTGPAGGALGGTYPNPSITLAGDVTGPAQSNTVVALQSVPVSPTAPTASQVLTYNGSAWSPAAPPAQVLPYVTPPTSPNAFNDEFSSGSSDLATRGWLFRNMATGTNMTRIGDVVPFMLGATALTANQYRSTLVRSCMLLQIPENIAQDIVLVKSVSIPHATVTDGAFVTARFGGQNFAIQGMSQVGNYSNVSVYADSGGLPDMNNRAGFEHYLNNNSIDMHTFSFVGGSFAQGVVNYPQSQAIPDILGIRVFDTRPQHILPFAVSSGSHYVTGQGLPSTQLNIDWAGMGFYLWNNLQESPGFIAIDYIRISTGDMSLAANWII